MTRGMYVSGFGVLLFIIGGGYWVWFSLSKKRIANLRSRSPIHLLGNLTVIGMVVFVIGRVMDRVD